MALIAKMVEKSIKIYQIFFSRKYIIKRVRKRSFIKNVRKLAILTLSLQDMKNSLWRKMAHTVNVFEKFEKIDLRSPTVFLLTLKMYLSETGVILSRNPWSSFSPTHNLYI